MSTSAKIFIAAAVALLVGLGIGFFFGRAATERRWSQPYAVLTPADVSPTGGDADPGPPAGTKIVKSMPIGRARLALAEMTAADPAISPTASIGASDEGNELHVTILNRGKCKITAASGVAYGFDAFGRPARTNKNGESYVAFTLRDSIAPGERAVAATKLRFVDTATLAVAHIDSIECEGGTSWKRS